MLSIANAPGSENPSGGVGTTERNPPEIMMPTPDSSSRVGGTKGEDAATGPRVFYCGAFCFPDRNAAANRAMSNALLFEKCGWRSMITGPTVDGRSEEGIRLEGWGTRSPWLRGVEYRIFPRGALSLLRRYRPDLVILYDFPVLSGLLLWFGAKLSGARVVGEYTEWYSASFANPVTGFLKWFDVVFRMHWMPRLLDGLIVASPWLSEQYERKGHPCLVLPTFLSDLEKCSGDIRRDDRDSFVFVYAGTPFHFRTGKPGSPTKERLDLVVEVIQRLREAGHPVELTIFGVERSAFLDRYPDREKKLDETGGVRFAGRRPRREVIEAIRRADFTIFFRDVNRVSLSNFPTKLSESIALGVPVITNRVAPIEELSDGETVLLCEDPSDLPANAAWIANLLDPRAIEAKKQACRDRGPEFSAERFRERTNHFLEKIGARKGGGA